MKRLVGLSILIAAGAAALFLLSRSRDKIDSEILGEKRPFLVHLPPGYRQSNAPYPVLYILDADDQDSSYGPSFQTIAKQVDAKVHEGMPPMIIIGVVNTHRSRDMLPITTLVYPESGGADGFLAFLTEELIPTIDNNFRTTGERILYGRSESGLFTLYALFEKPEPFSAYISASPTVGHCPTLLRIKAGQLFREQPLLEKSLFIVYSDDDIAYAEKFIPALIQNIRQQATNGFRFGVNIIPGGGHIPKTSLYDGLRFTFSPRASAE